ncbi:N-(5'-phosphoribosyl)anthranilate isomerase [Antarctobacter sp.]|uniref:N-(5'-phosphoribosyl)anthranilate isomerase n=1 Tax=Antarctobacter sp. TaxID=1872577 RepID=UPI003A93F970
MTEVLPRYPDRWLDQVFSAQAVAKRGVIRRSVVWVEHEIGRDRFIAEVRLRGFHLLEGGGQFIVICCRGPVRKLV